MRTLVESLKRIFAAGRVTQERLWQMVEKGTISETEYREIVTDEEELP